MTGIGADHLGTKSVDEIVAALSVADKRRARLLVEMLAAGLAAVDPETAVVRALSDLDLDDTPMTIVALGKAAPAMARAAAGVLGRRMSGGIVVSNHVETIPAGLELLVTSHPTPDQSSLRAGQRLLDLVAGAPPASRVLFLVSGGGSALAEVAASGLDLGDLTAVAAVLTRAGIPIEEMNTVRTHISAIKGGRLAAAATAPPITILISDVPGSAPHLIASGPTVPCPTTPGDALAVLARHHLTGNVPRQVIGVLESASPPPVVPGSYVLAADGPMAAEAAAQAAENRDVTAAVSPIGLTGLAADMAARALTGSEEGAITVFAGETTVEVTGAGIGGRNQQAALAASLMEPRSSIFVAFGTDGIDGPTDAAGAMIDGSTAGRIRAAGIDPAAALASNDSHQALAAAGAIIRCGTTGTNVADLWIVDRR